MKKELQKIGQSVLVILFLYYYLCNVSFVHTHVYASCVVKHSHPYIPSSQHTHDAQELETIACFNGIILWATPVLFFAFFVAIIWHPIYSYCRFRPSSAICIYQSWRAPPVYF